MHRALTHELALVLGGAVLGVLGETLIALLPLTVWWTTGLTVGALALILYGFAIPQRVWKQFVRAVRTRRWRKPRIGILAGLHSTAGDG